MAVSSSFRSAACAPLPFLLAHAHLRDLLYHPHRCFFVSGLRPPTRMKTRMAQGSAPCTCASQPANGWCHPPSIHPPCSSVSPRTNSVCFHRAHNSHRPSSHAHRGSPAHPSAAELPRRRGGASSAKGAECIDSHLVLYESVNRKRNTTHRRVYDSPSYTCAPCAGYCTFADQLSSHHCRRAPVAVARLPALPERLRSPD